MDRAKNLLSNVALALAVFAALAQVSWIIALKDYSYAILGAPVAMMGVVSLVLASILSFRPWALAVVPAYAIPFLPWVDWMYG